MTQPPTHVLVVCATGSIGRRVVAAAQEHGLRVTALVRDPARARSSLPGADLVTGDLEQPGTLTDAVQDVDAIVFTHVGNGSPDQARRIDYGGVANGYEVTTCPDIRYLGMSLGQTRPELFFGVPRTFEKLHAGVRATNGGSDDTARS